VKEIPFSERKSKIILERISAICRRGYIAGEKDRKGRKGISSAGGQTDRERERAYPFYHGIRPDPRHPRSRRYHFVKSSICGINVAGIPTSC